MQKRIILAGLVASLGFSISHSQIVNYEGYRYDLVGKLRVDAKLINCKPLKHAPKKTINIRNQTNNKISISFLDNINLRISNDDAGRGLNDQSNRYLPENYVVEGSVFSRNVNKLRISRRNDNINYNEGAQSLLAIYNEDQAIEEFFNVHNYDQGAQSVLPIYNRLLRWKIRTSLGQYLPADSVSTVDNSVLKLLNHHYTPQKFTMDMTLTANGGATLKEQLVAQTTFAVPSNSYIPQGTCTIKIISKRLVKSAPGTQPIPLE